MVNTITVKRLTETEIQEYLQGKQNAGVAPAAVAKYKVALYHLMKYLGTENELTSSRLQEWRQNLNAHGYGKITIQRYVTVVNDFLRTIGHCELCIPKPAQNNLEGRSFGYLTVLKATDKRKRRVVVWQCICKCGKEVEVPTVMLLNGHTTSCGCLNTEILQHVNRYVEGTSLRQCLDDRSVNPNSASGYIGVQPKRDKWVAYINYKGVRYNLGTYSKIEDAVKARARGKEWVMEEATKLYEEYADSYGEMPRRPLPPEKVSRSEPLPPETMARRSDNTSGQTGVTKQKGKWNASIGVKGYRYRLGAFENFEDAVAIRKKAETLIKNGELEALKSICTNWK